MDPFITQKLIKDNAEDLNTYLRDLKNWETDIKKKDAELRGIENDEDQLYPEIRSKSSNTKEIDENKSSECGESLKSSKISGFDYASWDKMDIDKVCEEIDSNEEKKMREAAMYEKDKGNMFVQAKNWEKAINCYTKAIRAYSKDARFFANRGLCHLKLKDFQKAEEDCSQAINLDPEYVKAWLRRSAAWEGLGKIELAKRDLKRVLTLEQRNTEAKRKLIELDKLSKDMETSKSSMIEAIGDDSKTEGHSVKESKSAEIHLGDDPGEMIQKHTNDEEFEIPWKHYKGEVIKPIQKAPHRRSKKPLRRILPETVVSGDCNPNGAFGDASSNPSSSSDNCEASVRNIALSVPEGSSCEIPSPEITELPPVPKSSVQFLMDWKMVKLYPNFAVPYLKRIPPESLPVIFGNSLEITTLEEILNTMGQKSWLTIPSVDSAASDGISTYKILKYLSCVPRFSTLSMFLNSDEKMITRELLAHCMKIGECSTEEAADLGFKFMI